MSCSGFRALVSYILITLNCVIHNPVAAQVYYPDKHWQVYENPAEAGWSVEKLNASKQYSDSIGLAAVMIIHKGAVVSHWLGNPKY